MSFVLFFFSAVIKSEDSNLLEVFQCIVVTVLFDSQLFHFGQVESNQLGTSILLDMILVAFGSFFSLWYDKNFQVSMVHFILCHRSGISHFFKEYLFFSVENCIHSLDATRLISTG